MIEVNKAEDAVKQSHPLFIQKLESGPSLSNGRSTTLPAYLYNFPAASPSTVQTEKQFDLWLQAMFPISRYICVCCCCCFVHACGRFNLSSKSLPRQHLFQLYTFSPPTKISHWTRIINLPDFDENARNTAAASSPSVAAIWRWHTYYFLSSRELIFSVAPVP